MYMFTTPTIGDGAKADSYVEAEDLLVLARSTPKSGSEILISLLRLIWCEFAIDLEGQVFTAPPIIGVGKRNPALPSSEI